MLVEDVWSRRYYYCVISWVASQAGSQQASARHVTQHRSKCSLQSVQSTAQMPLCGALAALKDLRRDDWGQKVAVHPSLALPKVR